MGGCSPSGDYTCAGGFITGGASGGYALDTVTFEFGNTQNFGGGLGDIVVTVHADNSGVPASSTLTTLSGANPSTAGQHTFTCTTGCDLAANTAYFIQATATAGSRAQLENYNLRTTQSLAEVLVPTGNGWSLANEADYYYQGNWASIPSEPLKLKIDATTR